MTPVKNYDRLYGRHTATVGSPSADVRDMVPPRSDIDPACRLDYRGAAERELYVICEPLEGLGKRAMRRDGLDIVPIAPQHIQHPVRREHLFQSAPPSGFVGHGDVP